VKAGEENANISREEEERRWWSSGQSANLFYPYDIPHNTYHEGRKEYERLRAESWGKKSKLEAWGKVYSGKSWNRH